MNNQIKSFDNYVEFGIEPAKFDIRKCIKYVARAWNSVIQTTIKNCWLKIGILPIDDETSIENADIPVYLTYIKELEVIQELIDKLNFDNPLTADEFVHYDDSETTAEIMSNEEILKAVLPNDQEEEVEELNLTSIVSHNEAIDSYNKIILYLKQG